MALQTVKTTIQIDPQLLYQAKLRALQEGKTLKKLIEGYLQTGLQSQPVNDTAALKKLARETLGKLKLKNYPEWSTKEKVIAWQRKMRQEEWPI